MFKLIAACAFLLLCVPSLGQTTRPASLDDLKFAVGGEWTVDAKWANGTPLKAVARFEYFFDGKFIRGESFKVADDGSLSPRELVIFYVSNGELMQSSFNADGNTRTAVGHVDADGTLVFESLRRNPDGSSTPVKQSIKRLDDHTCQQTFMMNIRGEWHTLIDATWQRTRS